MTNDNSTFEKLNTILVNRSNATRCSTKLGKSEVITTLKVHTALIIEVIEILIAKIIVILEPIIVLFIKVLRTEILAIMIITSQMVIVEGL